jgi:hypothetical protein
MSGIIDHTDSDHEDDFYFESDHLALKDNSDYTAVLKTLAILEVQRTQCLLDIDSLVEAERRALEDPLGFVEKLKAGEDLGIPKSIDIQEVSRFSIEKLLFTIVVFQVPSIDFEKYNVNIPESPKQVVKVTSKNDNLVRGRMFDQTKPETFNQVFMFRVSRNRSITNPPIYLSSGLLRSKKDLKSYSSSTLQKLTRPNGS